MHVFLDGLPGAKNTAKMMHLIILCPAPAGESSNIRALLCFMGIPHIDPTPAGHKIRSGVSAFAKKLPFDVCGERTSGITLFVTWLYPNCREW